MGICTRADIVRARADQITLDHRQPGWLRPIVSRRRPRRVLLVGNLTLGHPAVAEALRPRAAAGPGARPRRRPHRAPRRRRGAAERLADQLQALRGLGFTADGEILGARPVAAVRQALRGEPYDEIILSTLPAGVSGWLRMDAGARIERLARLPVTHVVAGEADGGRGGPDSDARVVAVLTDEQFGRILEFRVALRRFGRFSEEQAAQVEMTAQQHQLLLAIRGHGDPLGPTIADVARHLLIRHHSAVGLVDRTQDLGLIERRRDADDHRLVRLALTPLGHERGQRAGPGPPQGAPYVGRSARRRSSRPTAAPEAVYSEGSCRSRSTSTSSFTLSAPIMALKGFTPKFDCTIGTLPFR